MRFIQKRDKKNAIFFQKWYVKSSDLIYDKKSRILLLGSKEQSNLKIDNRLVLTLA